MEQFRKFQEWLGRGPLGEVPADIIFDALDEATRARNTTAVAGLCRLVAMHPKMKASLRVLCAPPLYLGPMQQRLGRAQESIIAAIFKSWRDAAADRTPVRADIFAQGGNLPDADFTATRILMVLPRYLDWDERFLESDAYISFMRSAAIAEATVEVFDEDELPRNRVGPNAAEGLERLSRKIADFRPDILLIDANFPGTSRSLNADYLRDLKDRFSLRIVAFVQDWYIGKFARLHYWEPVADLILAFNDASLHEPTIPARKLAVLPGLPLCASERAVADPEIDSPREYDVSVVGRLKKDRWIYALLVMGTTLSCQVHLHGRTAKEAVDYDGYLDRLRAGWCAFGTGTRDDDAVTVNGIPTGRLIECMLTRTVALHTESDTIDQFYIPYVHYVPVRSAQEFAIFCQYFAKHADERRRITRDAADFHLRRYGPAMFWRWLVARAMGDRG